MFPVICLAASRADGSALRFILLSVLLFLTPMALFCVLALSVAPYLRRVAAATLFALNISSADALLSAWRGAFYGEDGFVVGTYIAISVTILVISFVVALRHRG
jgi:hypothetical protein